jgi:CHAT domain-containing protein
MTVSTFLLILLFTLSSLSSMAQYTKTENEQAEMYQVIEEQINLLFGARGLSSKEIDEQLEEYRGNKILSNDQLALILQKLYPSDAGIGILLYFFNKDTLQRIFMVPGRVIEQKTIAIKKQQLLQLSNDFNQVLSLYSKSNSRMPRQRGAIVTNQSTSTGLTYAAVIKKATDLLLPLSFDETYKHLLIIPALNIGTIPFHLLQPYKNENFLIDNCSFTIVPTLLDIIGLRGKILKRGNYQVDMQSNFDSKANVEMNRKTFIMENALFISNPSYPTSTDFIFPDLPGAKKEIANAKIFATDFKLFEGKAAVKDSVFKYIRRADVAYFATHGIADEKEPMEKSFLVLSGKDPFLTAKNIQEFGKTASRYKGFPEMIILSACQTGLGKAMEAGVAGLARSFLLAGSNHVVMSLWNVDDNATAYLMNRFIYHLQQPNRFMPSGPLRLAILDTKKKFPNPAQWASFSVFGINY